MISRRTFVQSTLLSSLGLSRPAFAQNVTEVSVTSELGTVSGRGDVLVIRVPDVSARIFRTAYGITVVLENGSLHGPRATDRSGRWRIAIDGRTVFDGELTLLGYGRCKLGPFLSEGKAPVIPAMTDEVRRRAHMTYGVTIPEALLASLPQRYPKKIVAVPGRDTMVGSVPAYMATTGANPNIGILPAHAAIALATGDRRAVLATLAEADAFFAWPVHYRDEKTGRIATYAEHPYASLRSSDRGDNIAASDQTAFQPDTAHQPHALFVAYLLTGEPCYLEEMVMWDYWNFLMSPDSVRLAATSLIRSDSAYQTRGAAWVLVARGQLLSVLPREHPSFATIAASVEANARIYRERFIDGTFDETTLQYSPYAKGGARNALGLFCSDATYDTMKDGSVLTAGWQNAFMVQMWAYLVALDLPVSAKAKEDLDAVMRFGFRYVQRLGPEGGWDVRRMGVYGYPCGAMVNGRMRWYASHAEAYGHISAPLPPLPARDRDLHKHDSNEPVQGFDSFEANEWPAVVFAKMHGEDKGAFDAIVATDTFRQLATSFAPQWALVPPGETMASLARRKR